MDREMSEGAVSFKYRGYDGRTGRFSSIDPLSAKYPYYSTYAFSGNRVIDMIELEGLEPISPDESKQYLDIKIVEAKSVYIPSIELGPPAGRQKNKYTVSRINGDPREKITVSFDAADGIGGMIGAGIAGGIYTPDITVISEALDSRWDDDRRMETVTGLFAKHISTFAGSSAKHHVTDGWGKVFRHMVWQGIITIQYGRETAENVGNAFERGFSGLHGDTANEQDWSFVDILNNEYARQYAEEFQKKHGELKTKKNIVKFLNFMADKTVEAYNKAHAKDKNRKKAKRFRFKGNEKEVRRLTDALGVYK